MQLCRLKLCLPERVVHEIANRKELQKRRALPPNTSRQCAYAHATCFWCDYLRKQFRDCQPMWFYCTFSFRVLEEGTIATCVLQKKRRSQMLNQLVSSCAIQLPQFTCVSSVTFNFWVARTFIKTEFCMHLRTVTSFVASVGIRLDCRCSRDMASILAVCFLASVVFCGTSQLAHQEKCCVFSHPFIRHPLVLFSWSLRTVPAW